MSVSFDPKSWYVLQTRLAQQYAFFGRSEAFITLLLAEHALSLTLKRVSNAKVLISPLCFLSSRKLGNSAVMANLALSRIRLHKNKRTEQGKILSREVLSLLLAEKEDQARIRVRHFGSDLTRVDRACMADSLCFLPLRW